MSDDFEILGTITFTKISMKVGISVYPSFTFFGNFSPTIGSESHWVNFSFEVHAGELTGNIDRGQLKDIVPDNALKKIMDECLVTAKDISSKWGIFRHDSQHIIKNYGESKNSCNIDNAEINMKCKLSFLVERSKEVKISILGE